LIWFFTISWCYIIAIFSKNTGRNNILIPFALVFMTMPVWAEQFYFLLQAAENAFIIGLCPYVIYLLYKGFLDNEKDKIVYASLLLIFMTSVYQAIIPLFCCGVFACFVLFQEHSDHEPKIYRNLCLKLFITLIGSLLIYFIIARVIIPGIFHIEKSDYIDSWNNWRQKPFKENVNNILRFGYTITMGNNSLFQAIVNPIIANHAKTGIQAAEALANQSKILGNSILLPCTVLFLYKISSIMRKVIPSGRRLLYILAGIGIPLSIILLAIIGGTLPVSRSLYSLPLALAFMFFFLIKSYKKKVCAVIACIALLTAGYQAQITAQLFYSDQIRYNEDVRLAFELEKLIVQVQPDGQKLPVVLVGKYQSTARFRVNFLQGEVIGHSFFDWGFYPEHITERGLPFMKSLGIYFDMPDKDQINLAVEEAASIPSYPDPNCVRRINDFIVVKISETLY
jgi:hypothetical protein